MDRHGLETPADKLAVQNYKNLAGLNHLIETMREFQQDLDSEDDADDYSSYYIDTVDDRSTFVRR